MKKTVLLSILLCFLVSAMQAQGEAANWYFGDRAGLNFNTSPPTALTDGALTTLEGCATISDSAGNLLKEVFSKNDGSYQIEVPWRNEVALRVYKSRYSMFTELYQGDALEEIQKGPLEIAIASVEDIVEEKEEKTVLRLDAFVFPRGKSSIGPAVALQLDRVVEVIEQFPQIRLRIENHTDSRGSSKSRSPNGK